MHNLNVEPFDVYAATETAGVAAECERHNKHLFEDLLIVKKSSITGITQCPRA